MKEARPEIFSIHDSPKQCRIKSFSILNTEFSLVQIHALMLELSFIACGPILRFSSFVQLQGIVEVNCNDRRESSPSSRFDELIRWKPIHAARNLIKGIFFEAQNFVFFYCTLQCAASRKKKFPFSSMCHKASHICEAQLKFLSPSFLVIKTIDGTEDLTWKIRNEEKAKTSPVS